MNNKIRVVAGSLREAKEEDLLFAKQMGCSGVTLNTPPLTGRPPAGSNALGTSYWLKPGDEAPPLRWDFLELLQLRQKVESFGLQLESIENTPLYFYEDAILGGLNRDRQIENYQETVRNLGRAGIPILGYHWMANRVWRTSKSARTRGNATTSTFDYELARHAPYSHGREYNEDEIWQNYRYFIDAVLPVAQQHDVVLALHPDDPPVASLGGIPRIFRNIEGFRRAMEDIGDSPHHKLDFCMGTWAEMGIEKMFESMEYFATRGRIAYLHFRNVRGCVPSFEETFIDDGDIDVVRAMKLLIDVGFDGFLIDDHVPHMIDDTLWMHRGRAFATGYIKGLLRAVEALS